MTKIEKLEKALSESNETRKAAYAHLSAQVLGSPEADVAYRAWAAAQGATDRAAKALRDVQDAARPRGAKRVLVDSNTGRLYVGRVS